MNRRSFLGRGFAVALAAAGIKAGALASRDAVAAPSAPSFATRDRDWQAAYDKALQILHEHVQVLPRFDGSVLIEGAEYAGIWQECGPLEALLYRSFRPGADAAMQYDATGASLQCRGKTLARIEGGSAPGNESGWQAAPPARNQRANRACHLQNRERLPSRDASSQPEPGCTNSLTL